MRLFGLTVAILLGATLLANGPARADCGAIPDVAWWNDVNPEAIKKIVDRRHSGDWAAYIAKWERQMALLTSWRDSGAAAIPFAGAKPDGKTLSDYIEQVDGRLNVAYCLAAADGFKGFGDFAVASGDEEDGKPAK